MLRLAIGDAVGAPLEVVGHFEDAMLFIRFVAVLARQPTPT